MHKCPRFHPNLCFKIHSKQMTYNVWKRYTFYILFCLNSNSLVCTLTCTAAGREAQSPLGAVEHNVEAFHNGSADHQAISWRRQPEAEAVQRAVHVCDWLDVELRHDREEWGPMIICVS